MDVASPRTGTLVEELRKCLRYCPVDTRITVLTGEAADEIERLRAALAKYGDHLYECELKNNGACSCGYDAALGLSEVA